MLFLRKKMQFSASYSRLYVTLSLNKLYDLHLFNLFTDSMAAPFVVILTGHPYAPTKG